MNKSNKIIIIKDNFLIYLIWKLERKDQLVSKEKL
jgi:hypothetical protein